MQSIWNKALQSSVMDHAALKQVMGIPFVQPNEVRNWIIEGGVLRSTVQGWLKVWEIVNSIQAWNDSQNKSDKKSSDSAASRKKSHRERSSPIMYVCLWCGRIFQTVSRIQGRVFFIGVRAELGSARNRKRHRGLGRECWVGEDALYSPEKLRAGVMPRNIHSGLQEEELNDTCVCEWKQLTMT